jgi:riboflavin biosynthesis pyrimidine reductase
MSFSGPGGNFELLFEQSPNQENGLPDVLREIYGGNWCLPDTTERVYSYSNFVISHDGKISFNVKGHEGGGDVSGFNKHDQWVMALARSRADAVVVGANTLRVEPEHEWTAEFIFPSEAKGFAQLRVQEKRAEYPLQVMVSKSGDIAAHAAIFKSNLKVLIATSESGADRVRKLNLPNAEVRTYGADEVDIAALYASLHQEYDCQTVLCEGGPRLYASLIQSGQLDEEFLTLSPVLVGSSSEEPRPGLFEGVALQPGNDLLAKLSSVRRFGNHLFIRTIWR